MSPARPTPRLALHRARPARRSAFARKSNSRQARPHEAPQISPRPATVYRRPRCPRSSAYYGGLVARSVVRPRLPARSRPPDTTAVLAHRGPGTRGRGDLRHARAGRNRSLLSPGRSERGARSRGQPARRRHVRSAHLILRRCQRRFAGDRPVARHVGHWFRHQALDARIRADHRPLAVLWRTGHLAVAE